MKSIIRLGDKTTHGGVVISASAVMRFQGIAVARQGDRVTCPLHGITVIIEGHSTFTDNGIPVALEGHRCACGCQLISSLPSALIG